MRVNHGKTHTKEYKVWTGMKERINNPNRDNYKYYGERKITMHKPWQDSFQEFYNYMIENFGSHPGNGYSIDRINNNGNYEPGNVRWANSYTQTLNSRQAHMITYQDKTMCMKDWAKSMGIPYQVLQQRINKYHWTISRALTQPMRKSSPRNSDKFYYEITPALYYGDRI